MDKQAEDYPTEREKREKIRELEERLEELTKEQ